MQSGRAWYKPHAPFSAPDCVYVLEHGTQCVFSKFMQDEDGNTALIQACRRGHVETARVLLNHGTNVDHQNNVSSKTLIS